MTKKSLHVKISVRDVLSHQVPEAVYGPYYVGSPTWVKQTSHVEVRICFPFTSIPFFSLDMAEQLVLFMV